jgi:hypothetical protein
MNSLNDLKPGDSIYIRDGMFLNLNLLYLYSEGGAWKHTVLYVNDDYIILNEYWRCVLVNYKKS